MTAPNAGPEPRFRSVAWLAREWSVSEDLIYKMIKNGELRSMSVRTKKVIPVEEIDAYEQRMAG